METEDEIKIINKYEINYKNLLLNYFLFVNYFNNLQ
jgi:hypothetical protein